MTTKEAIDCLTATRLLMYTPDKKEYATDLGYALEEAIHALCHRLRDEKTIFNIGDEVISQGGSTGYVTRIDKGELCVLYKDGYVGHSTTDYYTRTGRNSEAVKAFLAILRAGEIE